MADQFAFVGHGASCSAVRDVYHYGTEHYEHHRRHCASARATREVMLRGGLGLNRAAEPLRRDMYVHAGNDAEPRQAACRRLHLRWG